MVAGASGVAGAAGALVAAGMSGIAAVSFFWQPVNRPAQTRLNIAANNKIVFIFR